jgi:microcystin-dependent protein
VNQIAAHSHPWLASEGAATSLTPAGNVPAEASKRFYVAPSSVTPMAPAAMSPTGGSQPHTNFQPYLCIDFIISLFGIFPSPT